MPHALNSWLPLARDFFSRFRRDRRGNVAPIFAIAMLPIFALTGTAVDYSRANAARTEMQAALDATALTMSKEAIGLTQEQLNTKATEYFNASFANLDAKNMTVVPVLVTPQAGSFTLTVTASGSVDLRFMGVFGQSSLPISSSTEVKWGIKKLELAIVLDNTGWSAVKESTRRVYPKGIAETADEFQANLLPTADFAKVATDTSRRIESDPRGPGRP